MKSKLNLVGLVMLGIVSEVVHAAANDPDPYANTFNKDVKTSAQHIDGYIIDSDYPKDAIEAGASGVTIVDFVVGPTGIVSQCGILKTSGSEVLDSKSCELLRARFTYKPALDKNRKPIAERRVQPLRWVLPETPLPSTYDFTITYQVDKQGRASNCVVTGYTTPTFNREKACKSIPRFAQPVDATGQPVERIFKYRQSLTSNDLTLPTQK